jgi:hypothetical protein
MSPSDLTKPLLPLVKAEIHFDSLYAQASRAVVTHGGQVWTEMGEHDPGVTLLEGYSYSTSDLSYRHTLPFTDLLTPPVDQQTPGDGIFPADFGPQTALTCGPITPEDYRRALLDLTDSTNTAYLFRDVQLIPLNNDANTSSFGYADYWYYFDTQSLEYSFVEPTTGDGSETVRFWLRGNYALCVELTRDVIKDTAEPLLNEFLTNHRNLCEAVTQIRWAAAQEINPVAQIELEEGVRDIAAIYAAIYAATVAFISPTVNHQTTSDLTALGMTGENIFEGPYLERGWQTDLPPQTDYSQKVSVNVSGLAEKWVAINGVKSIVSLRASQYDTWSWTTDGDKRYPRLWGDYPLSRMVDEVLLITSDGTYVSASEEEIKAKLPPVVIQNNEPVVLPYGTPRNVSQYHPVSDKLPACYGMQQLPTAPMSLYQYLLPFEQAMANGCQQLAMLPQVLSFERSGSTVWGTQWPYASGSIGDSVHVSYKDQLIAQSTAVADDYDQELRILNYLLGYFGTQQAARMLDTSTDEFLTVEQDYLGQITTLAYQRNNIRVDEVSALQKRISARLGLGANLFVDPVDMSKLPFYIVEHRVLLPEYPSSTYNAHVYPTELAVSSDNLTLTVTCPSSTSLEELKSGQLIDFVLEGGLGQGFDGTGKYTLQALIVDKVIDQNLTLNLTDNPMLQLYLQQVLEAQQGDKLYWQNCQVWLREIVYPLAYAADTADQPSEPVTLTIPTRFPFPAGVRAGDTLRLEDIRTASGSSGSLKLDVLSVDELNGTLTVKRSADETNKLPSSSEVANYTWHTTGAADLFSMVVSLVLNKAMLPAGGDSLATEAWIKKCVQTELPTHVTLIVRWLSDETSDPQSFESFAGTYAAWQDRQTAPSNSTYQLLWKLGLGVLPAVQVGIGTMNIATEDQRTAVIGNEGSEWNVDAISKNSLLFVPKHYSDI